MATKDKTGRPLTAKQKAIVEEYLVDLCATQAAIRAGYSAKTADVQGPRLLGNVRVQAALEKAVAKRSKRTEISQDEVLRRLLREADGEGEDTNSSARIRASELIGKHMGMFVERQKIEHSGDPVNAVRITLVKPDGTEETETRKKG